MGLVERKAIKAAQDGWVLSRQKDLNTICGASIPLEFQWDSFADDAKAINWLDNSGPNQVLMALRGICSDAMGKEATAAGLKKIVFGNVADVKEKKLSFEEGVLELKCAFAQSSAGSFGNSEIRKCLEAKL